MENKNNDAYFNEFTKPVRKIGKSCLLGAIILGFLPALYVGIRYNAMPTSAQVLGGLVLIMSTELAYYFVEPISYFPVLGEAGTYMSFLAGSIGGIRVPTVTVAQETIGVEAGTQKAEIVSSIAVAASIVCSMAMGLTAVVIGNVLFAILPAFVKTMFSYVIQAIYGVLLAQNAPKKPMVAVFGLVLAMVLRLTAIIPSFFNMLVTVALCVVFGLYMAKSAPKKA